MMYREESEAIKIKNSDALKRFEDELAHLPDIIRTVATSTIPRTKAVMEKNKRIRRKANKAARKARRK